MEQLVKLISLMLSVMMVADFSAIGFHVASLDDNPNPYGGPPETIWVDDDYVDDPPNHRWNTIQEGVDDAVDGDTVYVYNGTYYEQVLIEETINLTGEDWRTTIVDGGGKDGDVIWIREHRVNVSGFTITNSGNRQSLCDAGITTSSNYNLITDNNIFANHYAGICLGGNYNTISGNNISSNFQGIHIFGSYNTISNNTISHNNRHGIDTHWNAVGNEILGNAVCYNGHDASYDGIIIQDLTSHYVISENIICSNRGSGIHIASSEHNTLLNNMFSDNWGAGVILGNSAVYNSVLGNNIISNRGGVGIDFHSNNNTISGNNISHNQGRGISIRQWSGDNVVHDNTVESNGWEGIVVDEECVNNVFYHNNIINHTFQAQDSDPENNSWHHPVLLEGNYWSDYVGADDGSGTGKHATAGDGIGDTLIPHPEADYDNYPFIKPDGWIPSPNSPPVANAGPDQTVHEGDPVQFDGTGSHSQGGNGGVWTLRTDALVPMTGAASTTLNDEIYLIGGDTIDCLGGPTSVVQKYNPSNDSWSRLPDLPAERVHLGAATVNGKIYAIGGSNGNLSTNTTFEYDPATNNWTTKAPMPIWMEGFGMAVANDRIYVVGGWSTFMYCYPCGMVFEYDPSADVWSTKPVMPTPRAYLAAVGLENKIYAIGGDARESMSTVDVYDPITEEWTKRANMTTNRAYLSAEALGGDIYAFGGAETSGPPLNSTEMYDPSKDSWTPKSPMIEAKVSPGSGVVGSCMYSAGGYGGIVPFSSNEEYCLGGELTYEWDFDAGVDHDGDGIYTNDKEATGPTPTHIYYDDGVYTVTLTVTDTQGLQDTDQCNITVLNVSPTPQWTSRSVDGTIINPPYPEGKEILFESTVYDPGIYDTFTYDWDFGDGTSLIDAGPSVVHAYGDNDTYIVVLKVTDDDGGVGIDDTPPLSTTNEDPVAWVSLPNCLFFEGRLGCPVSGSFSDPGWLDTHSAVWSFGDGEYESALITEENEQPDATGTNDTVHAYGDDGMYNITFTVLDDDGGTYTAFAWVSPMNLPPSIAVDIPSVVNEGEDFDLGITAIDPGSDDLMISVDWGDGTSDSQIFYNDGVGPDPPNSGPGMFPFTIQANFTHLYPDDGSFDITVTVEDDDGGSETKIFQIPVLNVAPTVELEVLPIEADVLLRIAGEKWHDVKLELYEDGILRAEGGLIRYPGSPNDQMLDLTHLNVDISKRHSAIVRYTPEDDSINGQPNGANPCWIILRFGDGEELWLHHTFNVQHEETYVWEVDLTQTVLMHGITLKATAYDPGSDDLTFYWDFGDGTNATSLYPNPNGTYPVIITEMYTHIFPGSGTFVVTTTVEDDDGGIGTASFTIHIP